MNDGTAVLMLTHTRFSDRFPPRLRGSADDLVVFQELIHSSMMSCWASQRIANKFGQKTSHG